MLRLSGKRQAPVRKSKFSSCVCKAATSHSSHRNRPRSHPGLPVRAPHLRGGLRSPTSPVSPALAPSDISGAGPWAEPCHLLGLEYPSTTTKIGLLCPGTTPYITSVPPGRCQRSLQASFPYGEVSRSQFRPGAPDCERQLPHGCAITNELPDLPVPPPLKMMRRVFTSHGYGEDTREYDAPKMSGTVSGTRQTLRTQVDPICPASGPRRVSTRGAHRERDQYEWLGEEARLTA